MFVSSGGGVVSCGEASAIWVSFSLGSGVTEAVVGGGVVGGVGVGAAGCALIAL